MLRISYQVQQNLKKGKQTPYVKNCRLVTQIRNLLNEKIKNTHSNINFGQKLAIVPT